MTLIELMVVTAIVTIFTASAVTVFIQLIQTSDAVDARLEAVSNARFFLDTLSEDLAQASISLGIPAADLFVGVDSPLTYGDLKDNDGDGAVDEEAPDGIDNDGDWTLANDDHDLFVMTSATGFPPLSTIQERGYQIPDLGDEQVDEDVIFNRDELTFWVPGDSGTNVRRRQVIYRIESFEGEDNVAVRRTLTQYNDGTPQLEEVGPLAFDVVGLNFLHWEHKTTPAGWVESWDNSGGISVGVPPAPAAVYAEITVHSDSSRLQLPPSRPLSTVRMGTVIVLESVLNSAGFPRTIASAGSVPTRVAGSVDDSSLNPINVSALGR